MAKVRYVNAWQNDVTGKVHHGTVEWREREHASKSVWIGDEPCRRVYMIVVKLKK